MKAVNYKRNLPFSVTVSSPIDEFVPVKDSERSVVLIYRPRDLLCQSTSNKGSRLLEESRLKTCGNFCFE